MNPVALSVGQLIDGCRRGDINFRFSAKSSAIEGIRGHQRVQQSRGEGYLAEYPVSIALKTSGMDLEVGGRIDGRWFDSARGLLCIEEMPLVALLGAIESDAGRQSQAQHKDKNLGNQKHIAIATAIAIAIPIEIAIAIAIIHPTRS